MHPTTCSTLHNSVTQSTCIFSAQHIHFETCKIRLFSVKLGSRTIKQTQDMSITRKIGTCRIHSNKVQQKIKRNAGTIYTYMTIIIHNTTNYSSSIAELIHLALPIHSNHIIDNIQSKLTTTRLHHKINF